MVKRILIDGAHPDEPRVVVADDGRLEEFDFESASKKQLKGNIYLAKITRVEPSLQAAFVEYGGNRQGFLPFSEIHYDYFHIPVADKEKLRELDQQGAREAEESDAADAAGAPAETAASPDDGVEPQPAMAESAGLVTEVPTIELVEEVQHHAPPPTDQEVAIENAMAASADPQEAVDGAAAPQEASAEPQQAANDEVEVMGEEADAPVIKRGNFHRRYKIQEVIRRNQIVLIQVVKEERGNKGASLTTYISIAGRYCVLMPNTPRQGGLSRRISNGEDRRRLRDIMEDIDMPEGASIIIRTAGIDRNKLDIKRDFEYLLKLWHSIRDLAVSSQAPALVYEEGNLIKRFIRDMYYPSISEIIVEGEEAFNVARDTMRMFLPSHEVKVKQHEDKMPIFRKYQIEDELVKLYDNRAYLKSGGYIVINPTEALVSIDVNSGRATRERNVEETASKTNLEAAYEIARQLRLRDLAGLVVIDFIDMMEGRNRRSVERALKDALASDRARIQVGRISPFGLMEMSRQRLRSSFLESNTVVCPHCNGTGMMRSYDSVAVDIIRAIESEVAKGKYEELHLAASPEVAMFVLNQKRTDIAQIEATYNVRVSFRGDHALIAHNFLIDKGRSILSRRRKERGEEEVKETSPVTKPIQFDSVQPVDIVMTEEEIAAEAEAAANRGSNVSERRDRDFERGDRGDRDGRRGRRRRGRGGRDRNRDDRGPRPERTEGANTQEAQAPDANGNDSNAAPTHQGDGEGKRMRFRDGDRDRNRDRDRRRDRDNRGERYDGERAPREHRQPEPAFAEGPAPIRVEAGEAHTHAPRAEVNEEGQSILRGLWRKIKE